MSHLAYRTKDNSSPQGKPRVWFCCHPADFDPYFKVISDEILRDANCAIWYETEPDAPFDEELLKDDLCQMQLVVIPVTARFLREDSRARGTEFAWAIERHIPILPLMQEPDLVDEFNEICGDLQFLDRNNEDETAIDYRSKLKSFLDSVLVGDELAAKIRAAFDAYVFLSYRKKDRKYAQKLMRLIHKSEFCRDIAIWYDEFLVPGENFNEAILDALKKSSLFTLLVTPNLVNEKNYVMTIEYPMAQQEGKTILPAETVPTDRASLEEKFAGIPECTDAYNAEALEKALKYALRQIATRENDKDPEHLFFIGLAYLNGIDVEVDTEKAVELLQSAAGLGLAEAAQKLADMYHDGFGVRRNYETSLSWKETYAECLKRKMYEEGDSKIGDELLSAMFDIAIDYYKMGQAEHAEATVQNILNLLKSLQDQFGEEKYEIFNESFIPRKYAFILRFPDCYSILAMFCEAQGKIEEAFQWQEWAADSLESFYLNQMSEIADLLREDEEALAEMEDMIWFELSECYESSIERYESWDKLDEAQAWKQRWAEMKEKRLPFARPDDEEDWDWFGEDDSGGEEDRDWFGEDDSDGEEDLHEDWFVGNEETEDLFEGEDPGEEAGDCGRTDVESPGMTSAKKAKQTVGKPARQQKDWGKISDEDLGMYAECAEYSPELIAYLEERIAQLEERYAQTPELELRYSLSDLYSAMRSLLTDAHYLEMEQHDRDVEELQREVQESTDLWLESFDTVLEINEEYSRCLEKAAEGGADAAWWQKKAEELAEKSEAERNRSDKFLRKKEDAEQRMDTDQLAKVEREWDEKVLRYDEQKAMWEKKIHQWDARTLELLLEYATLADQEYAKTPSEESETKRIEAYHRIARMFEQKQDLESAALWYRKELALLEERFSQTHNVIDHYDDIADACYSIGMLDKKHPDMEMLRRALTIYKEVRQYMPDSDQYMAEQMAELERLCAEDE